MVNWEVSSSSVAFIVYSCGNEAEILVKVAGNLAVMVMLIGSAFRVYNAKQLPTAEKHSRTAKININVLVVLLFIS